jgi:hypothetical protein
MVWIETGKQVDYISLLFLFLINYTAFLTRALHLIQVRLKVQNRPYQQSSLLHCFFLVY